MLGRLMNDWFLREGRSPFTPLQPWLDRADLVAVNLECALTDRETWYEGPPKAFMFKALPVAARILKAAGVRVVSLANNHALDAGETGLQDTLRLLDEQGIAHAGAGMTLEEASRPAIVDSPSGRISFLAYCNHQEDFAATPTKPGIRYLDLRDLEAAMATLRHDLGEARRRTDWLVVSFHWQPNWAPEVSPEIRRLAQTCVEEGASVVWGHSPHHFQGVELVDEAAILYSTGDFVDDYAVDSTYRNDRQLLFTVTRDARGIAEVAAMPVEIRHGEVMPAEPEARAWIGRRFEAFCRALGTRPVVSAEAWVLRKEVKMDLKSAAFPNGGHIPSKYTCEGENVSPPLAWSDVPEDARAMALVVDDPDSPSKVWVHWVLYNMPPEAGMLPEGTRGLEASSREGLNDFGDVGYGGPCPTRGTHRYRFKLYALDAHLDVGAGCSKSDLLAAMEGHVLAEAELTGTYALIK
jgi:poly-gamma-glutamate synthesis protein (capsule biosynthesis protein)